MRQIYQQTKTFLLQQEVWLFISVLLFFSYAFMQASGQLGWGNFYGTFFLLMLFFSPLLALVYWRRQRTLSVRHYRIIWGAAFVFFPIVFLFVWPNSLATSWPWLGRNIDPPLAVEHLGGVLAWLTLLGVEIILSWRKRRGTPQTTNWLFKRPIHHWALLVVLIFSIVMVPISNFFQVHVEDLSVAKSLLLYISTVVQTFIIYLSYYLIYYIHHHFLFNILLRQRGFLHYLIGSVGFLILFVPLQGLFICLFPAVHQFKIHPLGLMPEVFSDLSFVLPLPFFLLCLPFIIGIEWYRQANALSQLQQEKTATELQLLKQQINPHFFFNTLNNLYAMSLTQERETPETILQLSELMRYVIYKGQEETVPLKMEINYLRDYLDLQKIRLHQKIDLQFNVNIQEEESLLPPLLFIILIENAFKHGIEPTGDTGFLHLELEQKEKTIHFRCHNSQNKTHNESKTGGLGLTNLRRRLAMAFPDRHQLHLQNLETEYIAELTLEL